MTETQGNGLPRRLAAPRNRYEKNFTTINENVVYWERGTEFAVIWSKRSTRNLNRFRTAPRIV